MTSSHQGSHPLKFYVDRKSQGRSPPRSNRIAPRQYNRSAYRDRNLIERFFSRIKHFRRIATRYDKLACSYLAFVRVVCAVISYRYM